MLKVKIKDIKVTLGEAGSGSSSSESAAGPDR